jgi:pimeloyl-ACP methyl ester carboxylesterase
MSLSSTSLTDPADLQIWTWKGFSIRYQSVGNTGPAVVLIHGFGASCGHWRKNLPVLGETCRCYAIDLIGFGGSAKPSPSAEIGYTFETWGQQVADFCREVIKEPAFLVGNSIGCIVAMQTAVSHPESVLGVALINCSLRLLHDRKRSEIPFYRSFSAAFLQKLLANQAIGNFFFQQIAKPNVVRKILRRAYRRTEAVTDELIDIIMTPARDRGAAAVFLAFTRYSQGPLPEDLLPILPCQALILWGTEDPWEPIALARKWAEFPSVQSFIELEGLGHCPQDESPETVNPILQNWILTVTSTAAKCS